MENEFIEEKVSRGFEKFIGVGVLIISGLFCFLFIYFAITAFKNSVLNIGVLIIELIIGFIGYSLALLSFRLITGRVNKRNKYLLSNTSLLIWGTILGVGTIVMGLGAYRLVKIRKKNEL